MAPDADDLAHAVLSLGSAEAYIEAHFNTRSALLEAPALQATIASLETSSSPTTLPQDDALRVAAKASLHEARARLTEITTRAESLLSAHAAAVAALRARKEAFEARDTARADAALVVACRAVADAYADALRALHAARGADKHQLAGASAAIAALLTLVARVRREASAGAFGGAGHTGRVVKAVEARAVDSVIKARAVLVNVLDNEFRKFGWPMKVPLPGVDATVVAAVQFLAGEIDSLQTVSADSADFVPARTKWHAELAESWAVAAILRAPLARFKYHFLERFRPGEAPRAVGTARFDRPEWAAEFALDRIREATPFLKGLGLQGERAAEVMFAEGFCRVFADKVAYDCELALRTSTNDADADVLIAHASETAKQFDAKLRSGVLAGVAVAADGQLFASSLHVLSMNESFLTTWASSELRLADAEVGRLLARALRVTDVEGEEEWAGVVATRADLEAVCEEIVAHVGNASQKCRSLECRERVATFLKLTELPLLQSMRARLKEEVECVADSPSAEQIARSGRASFVAQLISDALEDRAVDRFYLTQENLLKRGFYDDEIGRLRALHSANASRLCGLVTDAFADAVRTGYMDQARFGEIAAPDAAVVLTHDLSDALIGPLMALQGALGALKRGIPCRKTASTIWRPVATRLDRFFFDDIVLQCFAGGSRNAMAVASAKNAYLTPTSCARMARQLAFDAASFVATFSVVSTSPAQFLPSSAECSKLLSIASSRVLLPAVPLKPGDEEVLEALRGIVESDEEDVVQAAGDVLQTRIGTCHIAPREALELLAIGGLRFAIRMM